MGGDSSPSEKSCASQTPRIEYRYLTHETDLLSFGPSYYAPYAASPRPKPPDLQPFESPLDWRSSRKTFMTCLSCAVALLPAYAAGSYAPPVQQISKEWNVSQPATLVGITTFTTGFAIAPMVLAPFSELNGRRPVFITTGILFVLCQLCCALTRSYGGMLAARFFSGVGGSTFSTLVGGVLSDMYQHDERNTPMTLFTAAAIFGAGLGPLISGFIAQHLDWRWVFHVQVIVGALVILAVCVFFGETRANVLLTRKAKRLNQWYEACEKVGLNGRQESKNKSTRIRWIVKADEERETLVRMIGVSCYRPFHLLITEPVVFFFSLWAAFSWAVLYLTFSCIPLVYQANHNFNVEQSGAVSGAICLGAILSTVLSICQENLAKRRGKDLSSPEARLWFSCIESVLMPTGLFWFGWTSFSSIHWIVPTLSIACATIGIFSIYLAVFNYLADTYQGYASSVLAAQSFSRNILGGVFPLIAKTMFTKLGFPGASSLLGGIGVLLSLVPFVLIFLGPRIRARSRFASNLVST